MIKRPASADQRNDVLACIVQSLIGSLTPNFAQVSFLLQGSLVKLRFDLKVEDEDSLEEVEETIFSLEPLYAGEYQIDDQVKIGCIEGLEEGSDIVIRMKP